MKYAGCGWPDSACAAPASSRTGGPDSGVLDAQLQRVEQVIGQVTQFRHAVRLHVVLHRLAGARRDQWMGCSACSSRLAQWL